MGGIDLDKAQAQLMAAIDGGVNYLDTAYIYPGSESAVGEILERTGRRDEVYIASKLPHYLIKSIAGAEKLFREELRRLRTDHIDYYLMHLLTDTETWDKLCALGIREWIAQKKQSGRIGQIGFSYHGGTEKFCRLVDVYDWDFCQIQYNYLDEHSQAGRRGLQYAHSKGLPVIIMEPLRGGRLVELPPAARKLLEGERSPAQWGLRWLWDQPEVTVVLSGMHSMEMVADNLAAAKDSVPGMLTDAERAVYPKIVEAISRSMRWAAPAAAIASPARRGLTSLGSSSAGTRPMPREKTRPARLCQVRPSAPEAHRCGRVHRLRQV